MFKLTTVGQQFCLKEHIKLYYKVVQEKDKCPVIDKTSVFFGFAISLYEWTEWDTDLPFRSGTKKVIDFGDSLIVPDNFVKGVWEVTKIKLPKSGDILIYESKPFGYNFPLFKFNSYFTGYQNV